MLDNFFLIYKNQTIIDKLIYLSVFLFPIFAISIHDWVSSLYVVLFCLSLYVYFKDTRSAVIIKEERYFSYIFLFYFFIFLLSSIANGWGNEQTHALGTMLRFIAIIPIFLMFRHLKYLLPLLIAGSLVAAFINILYLYDNESKGVYGPLFSSPMILISCIFIIPIIKKYQFKITFTIILLVLLICSVFIIFELGARSVLIAMLLVSSFYVYSYIKAKNILYYLVSIIVLAVLFYNINDNLNMRVDRISNGLSLYFNENNPVQATEKFTGIHGVAARFEMWRASQYFIAENPILGFGPNEYQNEIQLLIDKNLINIVAKASHPHNAYLHELYAKGFLGLIAMLLVLYYPGYVFIVNYRQHPYECILGLSILMSLTAFSFTESATFNNNNFSSVMLIYISIIFVQLLQQKKSIVNAKSI